MKSWYSCKQSKVLNCLLAYLYRLNIRLSNGKVLDVLQLRTLFTGRCISSLAAGGSVSWYFALMYGHMCTCAEIRAICCARPFSVHGNCWTSAACNWMLHTKDLAIPFVRVFCLIFFCSIGNLKKKHLNAVICKVQKCNSHLIFSGAA